MEQEYFKKSDIRGARFVLKNNLNILMMIAVVFAAVYGAGAIAVLITGIILSVQSGSMFSLIFAAFVCGFILRACFGTFYPRIIFLLRTDCISEKKVFPLVRRFRF